MPEIRSFQRLYIIFKVVAMSGAIILFEIIYEMLIIIILISSSFIFFIFLDLISIILIIIYFI